MGLGRSVLAQSAAPSSRPISSEGILLMAHGGSKDWNEQVKNVASQVDEEMPTEVAFGMADRATLQEGIDSLTARGVKQIVAVPLFISSYSSVIECTKYLLGLRPTPPKELADFTMDDAMPGMASHPAAGAPPPKPSALPTPVKSAIPIRMAPALDRHPVMAEILEDRVAAIAKDPARDVLVLVAHAIRKMPSGSRTCGRSRSKLPQVNRMHASSA
jgi:hypothetical protein